MPARTGERHLRNCPALARSLISAAHGAPRRPSLPLSARVFRARRADDAKGKAFLAERRSSQDRALGAAQARGRIGESLCGARAQKRGGRRRAGAGDARMVLQSRHGPSRQYSSARPRRARRIRAGDPLSPPARGRQDHGRGLFAEPRARQARPQRRVRHLDASRCGRRVRARALHVGAACGKESSCRRIAWRR
jgi:hypothetical protein